MRIAFLHGLESGPHGRKFRALKERWPDVLAPDCTGVLDVEIRVQRVREALTGQGPLVLVGSSFGGLVAAILADEPGALDIAGIVLCAPALQTPAAASLARSAAACVIVHGREDDIVPISASRVYAQRFGSTLIEVKDGHRLADSSARLMGEVATMLAVLSAASLTASGE